MSAGAVEASAEGSLRRSSQPAKAWCRASRMAEGPDLPSGRKGWTARAVQFAHRGPHSHSSSFLGPSPVLPSPAQLPPPLVSLPLRTPEKGTPSTQFLTSLSIPGTIQGTRPT